jgi:transposase
MKDETTVFALALGLQGTPWEVQEINLDAPNKKLTIRLGFARGSRFPHPQTGELLSAHDTLERTWRHMNFFQFACEIAAPLPRVGRGGAAGPPVQAVHVPWARPGSGFSLLFEAMMVVLCKSGMTVQETARILGEWPKRVWRALVPVVDQAMEQLDLSATKVLCIDETSTRKGHNYITVASDPRAVSVVAADGTTRHRARVVAVTEGRDSKAVGEVKTFLAQHQCPAEQIDTVVKDMSAAYEKGVQEHFPQAERVVDFFHVVKLVGEGFDDVRKREHRENPELFAGSLWAWRKREDNLTDEEAQVRSRLLKCRYLQTGRACMILEAFREIFQISDLAELEMRLHEWYRWARRSQIPEMKKAALTVKVHFKELLAFARTRLSNAAAEALNGLIQTAKRKSRGFRDPCHFRAIIFLLGGNLHFDLPDPFPTPTLNPQ